MRTRQSGMSLVEVMVAVMIGLIGILIITQAYINSDSFNRATIGAGGAQTNGLIGLYMIERDARMAGYGLNTSGVLGCGNIYWYYDPEYSSNVTGGTLPNITLAPVSITQGGSASVPDQLTIMYSSSGERMMPASISSFNKNSSEVSVDGTDGFTQGDLVLMVNDGGCTMGKITHVQGVAQKLQLNPGVSAPQNPAGWGEFPTSYAGGDMILNLGNPIVRTYFVGTAGTADANKLEVKDTLLQAAGEAPVSLMDGIVDLRAQYGKDTNGDNAVDTYDNTTPTTSADWLKVLAVRIGLLARIDNYEKPSVSGGNCDATTTAPSWAGGTFGAVDIATATSQDRCYRYRVFETTVPLRNMIWRPS